MISEKWKLMQMVLSKDIISAVNTGKTKYMKVGCHRNMLTNKHITVHSNTYEKVKNFKYLGSLLTNQKYIHEKIKCILKAGNSRYYSVQTLLSSRFLSKNLEIRIYKTIILPCATWLLY